MNISDVIFEMKLAGIGAEDIESIISLCKNKGFDNDFIDEGLMKPEYKKVFTIEHNDYNAYEDDEYISVEKFPHKNKLRD